MHLQKFFAVWLAGAMIAPAAMAKASGPLHIKNLPAKSRAAEKAKKNVSEKPVKAKRSRKSSTT